MGFLNRLLGGGATREPAADLHADYRAAVEQALLLRAHGDRARYPQVAAGLRQLAEMEERHAAGFRDHLVARGEAVPSVEPPAVTGNNQWQRAVDAFQRARQKRQRLVEQIGRWDPEEPYLVEFLLEIERESQRAFPVYEGVIMRSDPQALD